MQEANALAATVAAQPLASLMATKKLLNESRLDAVRAARARESAAFTELVSTMTTPGIDDKAE